VEERVYEGEFDDLNTDAGERQVPFDKCGFPVVYGVELKDVLVHEDLAVGSYRFAISRLIPRMTQVALQTHKKDLMRETPNLETTISLPSFLLQL
jgi:hypothetical protein